MKHKMDLPLRQWITKNRVEGVLFDLDDTLIKTTEIFLLAMDMVVSLYAKALPELDHKVIASRFAEINIKAYKQRAVNPNRWDIVIPELEKSFGLGTHDSLSGQALEILANIYKQEPEFEEGAEKLVQLLKQWQLKVGIVTHANIEWTMFKLDNLGLSYFFDHVEIISENQLHKSRHDWERAAAKINIPPNRLLSVGDNVKGDVQASAGAGFGEIAWIDKKSGWSLYRQGELPPGVIVVKNVSELLNYR